MVTIISGKINSGKTTKLLEIYNKERKGDGFATLKLYENGQYYGQEILHLNTEEKVPFSFVKDNIYSFFPYGLEFGKNIINNAITEGINPLFIDEIGPIELRGKGFSDEFKKAIACSIPIFVVIRESILDEVIEKYKINNYEVIRII